ncbi:MAG: tRNA (adenosine(37)-N6)-threonylcarbamoyltransferase complex dimerization subunit type 1 TsaB [Flavobacteriaceae bacterium]
MILLIETSTTQCSVGLSQQGICVSSLSVNEAQYAHAEVLHVLITQLLDQEGVQPQDLVAVGVSKGPGSYTGLRIGVSAAKGLCFALQIPLISMDTLAVLAQEYVRPETRTVAVLDARRDEVYLGVYDAQGNALMDPQPQVIVPGYFQKSIFLQEKLLFVGSGADKCHEIDPVLGADYHPAVWPHAAQMAGQVWRSFEAGVFEDIAYFEPSYLKDFIANKSQKKS